MMPPTHLVYRPRVDLPGRLRQYWIIEGALVCSKKILIEVSTTANVTNGSSDDKTLIKRVLLTEH